MEYLTAKEAGAIALEAQSIKGSYMRAETDYIMKQIAEIAAKGGTVHTITNLIPEVIENRLTHLGYGVKTTSDQRDGDWIAISW